MQLGLIGLGRMGANMTTRLVRAGHELHVYDAHADAVGELAAKGAKGSTSLEDLIHGLIPPRAVWMMLPAAAVDPVLKFSCHCWSLATPLSTAATPTPRTTFGVPQCSRPKIFTMSMSGSAVVYGGLNVDIAI